MPILALRGVLSGARQHICTFCYITWHGWPKKGKGDIFSLYKVEGVHMPLNIKNYFGPPGVPILALSGAFSGTHQLLCTYSVIALYQ